MNLNLKAVEQSLFDFHFNDDGKIGRSENKVDDGNFHNTFASVCSLPEVFSKKKLRCYSCPQFKPILHLNTDSFLKNEPKGHFDSNVIKCKRPLFCEPLNRNLESKNFDVILKHITTKTVSKWLICCNEILTSLNKWSLSESNFLHFSNFWLANMSMPQKLNILVLEYNFIKSEIQSVMAQEVESGLIPRYVFRQFLSAVFSEYPQQLLDFQGSYLFLNYLNILISGRTCEFRKLLSNVKCRLSNEDYVQRTLGIRAFVLTNFWNNIVNHFQRSYNVIGHVEARLPSDKPYIFQAVEFGYLEVVKFLLDSGKVNPLVLDSHRRSLVMSAVMHHQPDILNYLLSRPDVSNANECADSGNSPLHAAVTLGRHQLLQILLSSPKVDPNTCNSICGEATALHMAILLGDHQAVRLLLCAGANLEARMMDKTVWDLSDELQNEDILILLQSAIKEEPLNRSLSTEAAE